MNLDPVVKISELRQAAKILDQRNDGDRFSRAMDHVLKLIAMYAEQEACDVLGDLDD